MYGSGCLFIRNSCSPSSSSCVALDILTFLAASNLSLSFNASCLHKLLSMHHDSRCFRLRLYSRVTRCACVNATPDDAISDYISNNAHQNMVSGNLLKEIAAMYANREERKGIRIQSMYGRLQVDGGVIHLTGKGTR